MVVLIIYAHPNPNSFNHAILESFSAGLKEAGHTYEVSDLYSSGFNPIFENPDFAQFTTGQMPEDVVTEQQKVTRANALAFIYPIWWWAVPAILKGWYDRVLSFGFAYKTDEHGQPLGLLTDKKVIHITTTMGGEESYREMNIEKSIRTLDGATFTGICGVKQVRHFFLYSVESNAEIRKSYLDTVYNIGREF